METRDKFDEMFRSGFNGFEAEPSAGVWTGIAAELNTRKRKKTLMPLLGIAASVLILISAGLWIIPHQIKAGKKRLVHNNIKKGQRVFTKPQTVKNKPLQSAYPGAGEKFSTENMIVKRVKPHRFSGYKIIISNGADANRSNENKPVERPLMESRQTEQAVISTTITDKEVILPVERPVKENIEKEPVLAAVPLPVTEQPVAAPVIKAKHKIKNFGDLVNVVVAKVDKRKDKLIEFTDTDDDESTVTGINLGILKIKKEK